MKAAALFLLVGFFAAARGGAQSPGARIELREALPYAFNRGRITAPAGLGPRLELYGTNMAGDRRLLFVSEAAAGLSLDFALYNDGTLLELELVGKDAQGRPLSARHTLSIKAIPDEDRTLLRQLQFSYGSFPGPLGPGTGGLEAGDAEYLSRQINAVYFAARASYLPALCLAAWALAAFILAALPARKSPAGAAAPPGAAPPGEVPPRAAPSGAAPPGAAKLIRPTPLALGLALSAALSLTLLASFGPRPQLLVIEGALAGGPVEEAGQRRLDGYAELRWRAPAGLIRGSEGLSGGGGALPPADYLGLRSPRGAALPLAALEAYRYLLFSERPLVVREPGGALRIGGGPYLAAWGIRR